MARLITLTLAPANANTAAIAAAQTTAGAGSLTLVTTRDSRGVATTGTVLDIARMVTLTSTANLSAINFTVTGTDCDGNAITETRVGPNNNTVRTAKLFKVVTSITVDAAVGTNVSAGFDGTGDSVSHTIVLDHLMMIPANISVDVSGTVDFTVSQTFDDILTEGTASATFTAITALSAGTADAVAVATAGATGLRVTLNSYSNGATVKVVVAQGRRI